MKLSGLLVWMVGGALIWSCGGKDDDVRFPGASGGTHGDPTGGSAGEHQHGGSEAGSGGESSIAEGGTGTTLGGQGSGSGGEVSQGGDASNGVGGSSAGSGAVGSGGEGEGGEAQNGTGGTGNSDHCLSGWREDKCDTCSDEVQADRMKCAEVLDCYISNHCGPEDDCAADDGACSVDTIGAGKAPIEIAEEVYECMCE
jgi:hypothetical protein